MSGIVAFAFGVAPFGPVGSLSWYLIESSDAIAEMGMMVFLVGLHLLQRPNYGRLGAAGFVVAFVGTASIFLSTVIWLLTAYPVGEGAIRPSRRGMMREGAILGLPRRADLFPSRGWASHRSKPLPPAHHNWPGRSRA